jgi:hypothetical protein
LLEEWKRLLKETFSEQNTLALNESLLAINSCDRVFNDNHDWLEAANALKFIPAA